MALSMPMLSTFSTPRRDRNSLHEAPPEASRPKPIGKAGHAAVAEAILREIDARLVEDLRASVDVRRNGMVQQDTDLRAELGRTTSRARELEQKNSELVLVLQATKLERDHARNAVMQFSRGLVEAKQQADRERKEHSACQQKTHDLHQELLAVETERKRLTDTVAEYQAALTSQSTALRQVTSQLETEREQLGELMTTKSKELERLAEEKCALQVECRSFQEHSGTDNQEQLRTIASLEAMVDKLSRHQGDTAHLQFKVQSLEKELVSAELSRRELHNSIQELKGNIRVCCRVRPALENNEYALQFPGPNRLLLSQGSESFGFGFDIIFGEATTQAEVFNEVDGLVQSALDGYKVCIFAYGQTGSGKTYTMLGGEDPERLGLIPRSLRKILQASQTMRANGWTWCLQASFIEIYNEGFRDLLRGGDTAGPAGHVIMHDDTWGTVVTNVTCVEVNSMEEIGVLMAKAKKQQVVGFTDMNEVSSRSHSVFVMYLRGNNRELGTELHGALHLVDLAGSERLAKSGSTGDRLKETQNINRSLSSLADVFAAKAEGRAHVPFRNSKLTHLMEPCLSGQGKTLMLVHVGPEANNAHETLCTLRFAKQVSQCDTGGKPKRHMKNVAAKAQSASIHSETSPGSPSCRLGRRSSRGTSRSRSASVTRATCKSSS